MIIAHTSAKIFCQNYGPFSSSNLHYLSFPYHSDFVLLCFVGNYLEKVKMQCLTDNTYLSKLNDVVKGLTSNTI